jgi:hypothetical protein
MNSYLNLPDTILKKIIQILMNGFDDEGVDIFDDGEVFSYLDLIDEELKYFGVEPQDETDYTFFISLLRLNPDFQTKPILKPTLETYSVDYNELSTQTRKTTYNSTIKSYIPITKKIIEELEHNDLFYYYEGSVVDDYDVDNEIVDTSVSNIEKINKRR